MSLSNKPINFSQLLTECGLVSEKTLRDIKLRFPVESTTRQGLARRLIRQDLLTTWQLNKLIEGKHQGFLLGAYRLRSHLARGGMSSLYAAEHIRTSDRRALKILPPAKAEKHSYLPRFLREARLASELQHENIMKVFEVVRSNKHCPYNFMAMELLHGRDLFRIVAEDGPISIRMAAELIRQAAIGLHHAHQQRLVHRDVKPGNIFLTDSGVVKIIDLGLAAISESFDEHITRDFDERVIGTADYLAPEQAIDSHKTDHRADIYALGCTFYYLLTGQPPFADGSLPQRILAHQMKTPKDVGEFRRDVPEAIHELLSAMLVKDREQRIQTAELVAQKLTDWLANTPQPNEVPDDLANTCDPLLTSFARKLKRLVPAHRRPIAETPTDSIRAGETSTQQPQHSVERQSQQSSAPE